MIESVFDQEVEEVILAAQKASLENKSVFVGDWEIKEPYRSPIDWRDNWIYMLIIDRFNNPNNPPKDRWDKKYDLRQGGTFNGITQQLDYIKSLGAGAIWITPVLKNLISDELLYNYHGYSTQDFLQVDARFASDGKPDTAERELRNLVDVAHKKGLYVILDIVINHAGRVFDYFDKSLKNPLCDKDGNFPLSSEDLSLKWIRWEQKGTDPSDYIADQTPPLGFLKDDAFWPKDLRHIEFFRRRGKLPESEEVNFPGDFQKGDLGTGQRQFLSADEYKEKYKDNRNNADFRRYGDAPILNIMIRIYQYLIAKYNFDGFRIDTTKHVNPKDVEIFGNAIREFALSIGKKNFFTFGEISTSSETTLASFVGLNGSLNSNRGGFGIDSAVDYPLFYQLRNIVKGFAPVENLPNLFDARKKEEENLINSHGEASRFFVTFIDNHDHSERFNYPGSPKEQLTLALGLLFCLPGIPCLYYGTEQELDGTKDERGQPLLNSYESVREALWGKKNAFDRANDTYQEISKLSSIKSQNPALRYGRYYFRENSGNGEDFGLSYGVGSIVAFSRILNTQELLIVANTANNDTKNQKFSGYITVALELYSRLHEQGVKQQMKMIYSNLAHDDRVGEKVAIEIERTKGIRAMIPIKLDLMEIQIWKLA